MLLSATALLVIQLWVTMWGALTHEQLKRIDLPLGSLTLASLLRPQGTFRCLRAFQQAQSVPLILLLALLRSSSRGQPIIL